MQTCCELADVAQTAVLEASAPWPAAVAAASADGTAALAASRRDALHVPLRSQSRCAGFAEYRQVSQDLKAPRVVQRSAASNKE